MPRLTVLAILALCAFAPTGQDRQPAGDPSERQGRGALAVLRRDGILFPFAAFNRDTWRITWPLNLTSKEIPVTLASIPEDWWGTPTPGPWRARMTTGEDMLLELQAPTVYRTFCSPRLGVRTNYRSTLPLPPAQVEPFPKDALAISGDVPIEPIESVSRTSPEWSMLAVALLKDFNRVEEETLKRVRVSSGWRHNLSVERRRTLPVRLESWFRSEAGEPDWTVSYVEAVRQYPAEPGDDGCGLETLVSGWLHHYKGELKDASNLRGKITYCDRVGATFMLPFGRIRPGTRTYWVFQLSGWEDEWYEVAEVGPERVRHVIEVYAGGRRSCR
jgi:hypothetical protein